MAKNQQQMPFRQPSKFTMLKCTTTLKDLGKYACHVTQRVNSRSDGLEGCSEVVRSLVTVPLGFKPPAARTHTHTHTEIEKDSRHKSMDIIPMVI